MTRGEREGVDAVGDEGTTQTDRIACPWLVRRFIDPDAEFVYVPADAVLNTARRVGGYAGCQRHGVAGGR
jgi:hypothetical protein